MSATEGELSVKLVELDNIYLAVHDGDNKHFDDGTLRSGESTKILSIQKKIGQDQRKGTGQHLIVSTNNPPINLDNILANPGRSYQHTVGGTIRI
ncbi:24777_t:CDS:2, partial [Racocetra persica]